MTITHRFIKHIRYIFEAFLVFLMLGIFRLLPLDFASYIGGAIARTFGKFHKTDSIARKNIKLSLPELSDAEIDDIINNMWDNLGRTIAEYPWLASKKMASRIKYDDSVIAKLNSLNNTTLFIGGHFGNWEIPVVTAGNLGKKISLIYRRANNPYVERLICWIRKSYTGDLLPKGKAGAKMLIEAVKNNHGIGILLDQKMNDGIAIPFFARDAMTAPAAAQLAIKYDIPIYCVRAIRKKGVNFTFTIEQLDLTNEPSGDKNQDIKNILIDINNMFEQWIMEDPSQWFWVHNRWVK